MHAGLASIDGRVGEPPVYVEIAGVPTVLSLRAKIIAVLEGLRVRMAEDMPDTSGKMQVRQNVLDIAVSTLNGVFVAVGASVLDDSESGCLAQEMQMASAGNRALNLPVIDEILRQRFVS